MESDKQIVTITGISGFIGSQVCLSFLKEGSFRIRGTVRSTTNEAKLEPLKTAFGEYYAQLELVEADLLNEESLHKAIEGSTYVVHTASPYPIAKPKHEDLLIKPAVEGTMAVMRAAHKHKVKRVVITSSVVAIYFSADKKKVDFSVEDWSDLKVADAYGKSKTMAERAAWDFQASLPEEERFEIVTINPGMVLGPNLNKASFSSGDIVKKLMMKELPGLPVMQFPVVDVRDVAEAHLQGILKPAAANKRFMLCSEPTWFKDLGVWLHEVYGKDYKVVHKTVPKFVMRIVGLWDGEAAAVLPLWGMVKNFKNTETTEILGINFIHPKKSVVDMAATLIDTGYFPDKRKVKN
jgi:nucleoside-diphosphate-sugar epimerase